MNDIIRDLRNTSGYVTATCENESLMKAYETLKTVPGLINNDFMLRVNNIDTLTSGKEPTTSNQRIDIVHRNENLYNIWSIIRDNALFKISLSQILLIHLVQAGVNVITDIPWQSGIYYMLFQHYYWKEFSPNIKIITKREDDSELIAHSVKHCVQFPMSNKEVSVDSYSSLFVHQYDIIGRGHISDVIYIKYNGCMMMWDGIKILAEAASPALDKIVECGDKIPHGIVCNTDTEYLNDVDSVIDFNCNMLDMSINEILELMRTKGANFVKVPNEL